jgi:hypothetical protein
MTTQKNFPKSKSGARHKPLQALLLPLRISGSFLCFSRLMEKEGEDIPCSSAFHGWAPAKSIEQDSRFFASLLT